MRFATLFAIPATADVYDFFMPSYISGCEQGCMSWSEVAGAGALFIKGEVPEDAGADCAMPGGSAGRGECDCAEKDAIAYMNDSYAGPWCFCQGGGKAYCSPPNSTVEQLNLQLATSDVLVASFVTYEELPGSPAQAMLGTSESDLLPVEGASHKYSPPGRDYIMHFVPFRNLKPRQTYYYKVKSGAPDAEWTPLYSFRAPYSGGETRLATYGDMGHSRHNNMGNLKADCEVGTIDAIMHMGDHAYDWGFSKDRRGDGYMNVFQPVLQSCPWFPIIGNHEAADGDHYRHYEQMAAGEMIGEQEGLGFRSTADSAIGQHLSLGRLYGSGRYGAVPSNTSRYTSSNIGLVHIAGIDLMNFDDEQIAWLQADLQAANDNRDQVPWIMVAAHYQLYHKTVLKHWNTSAAFFFDESSESLEGEDRFQTCDADGKSPSCETLGDWQTSVSSKLEPLMIKYGVDIVNAGHVHDYMSSWPLKNGKVCQENFDNPRCPVYIVEGNGGVPGCPGDCGVKNCSSAAPWCRMSGNECGAYGRMIFSDAKTLRYEHVRNSDGHVIDEFVITQESHGPFEDDVTFV